MRCQRKHLLQQSETQPQLAGSVKRHSPRVKEIHYPRYVMSRAAKPSHYSDYTKPLPRHYTL
ncbi:hypothetical protein E2C01_102813 [Portunus trituberculatus]|uniref:Uncharacterized protein n=1 Tax=Portunus trituberculatus TaxID=210409 RepID=A0A5B7KJ91_PORTR|nr:hypothetical protein [Portunus trituberculatus]